MGYKTHGVPGRRKTRPTGRTPKLQPAAVAWLRAYLSGGPRPATEIQRVGQSQGFGWRTVNRCKAELGFTSIRRGHEWFWSDPGVKEATPDPEPTLRQIAEEIKQTVERTVRQTPEPVEKQPEIDTNVIEEMMTQTYVPLPPRPPKPNICDVSGAEATEALAKATKGQLERIKLELYEGAIAAHNKGKTEEVDRLWALANRVREQLGEKPRPEKYKPGFKPA